MKEIRKFEFEIRAENSDEYGDFITGQPIVYDAPTTLYDREIGEYIEVIDDGALDGTDLRDVRFLVNHNTDMIPLARSRNNNENSTMQMIVVPKVGMNIRVNLDTRNNVDSRALYSAVDRGDVSGMSYMYFVDGEYWELGGAIPVRHITHIEKVVEVSACTFPAYEATSIQTRGLAGALDSVRASLESAKAEARAIDDKKLKIKILAEA